MNNKVKLAPSILSADFAHLGEQVDEITKAGADYIHVDVMDGHFVPNISIGIPIVDSLHRWTALPLDVHLMIEKPENYIKQFAAAGASIITVHIEACTHIHRTLESIRGLGVRAGVSLNPATPLNLIDEAIMYADLVLVMSVNPGFGGQIFIPETLNKIAHLRRMLDDRHLEAEIEVDGGINVSNAPSITKAGAQVLAVGNSIFQAKEGITKAIKRIREITN
ncbi:MAG: ribulose-phosphate 3-epimerase [Chloroflexota bacterium]|nr:ribulose-phosphate 3-epimerase [Chloroflexota bacterium]